jgi:ComF family protein
MNTVRAVWDVVLNLLFPPPVAVGRYRTLTVNILARTVTEPYVEREVTCLAPLPFTHDMVRTTIHAAKYGRHTHAAHLLGRTLAPFVAEELADRRMLGTFVRPLVVPIPLHRARMRERGFNQAERIAEALIRELGEDTLTLAPSALERTKNTEHQTRVSGRSERLHNMRDAFCVRESDVVRGHDVLLLDDVITTGATLRVARDTLLDAGAREVLCVAVAH